MKFTGEFFIPSDEDSSNDFGELEIEHKQRYLSIGTVVEGKTVLDIACGEGYGTHILSSKAGQITGVDINPDLVQHASQKYGAANIRFLHGSVEGIPLESGSVDVVVSFETLEHVEESTQQLFLKEAKRVLRPGGILIVSTPNKKNYTDRYSHNNKFHLHELYEKEFEETLKGQFEYVQLYDQGMEVSSMILNKDHYLSQKPLAVIPVNNAYRFEGKYLIAVCSDSSKSLQTPISSIVPENEKTYFQLIDRILALQKEVEDLGSWGTRSAAEVETLLKERAALLEEKTVLADEVVALTKNLGTASQEAELARQLSGRQEKILEKLQQDLARSNHEKFLFEAEAQAVREVNAQRQFYNPGVDTIGDKIATLTSALSNRQVNGTTSHKAMATPAGSRRPPESNGAVFEELKHQIAKLEEHLQWYKRTYEERSFMGVIKQKIALKFRK